jgi:hypothetical protein
VDITDFIQDVLADMGFEGLSGHEVYLFPENFPEPAFKLEKSEKTDRVDKIDQHIDIAPLPLLSPNEGAENADFGHSILPPQFIQMGEKCLIEIIESRHDYGSNPRQGFVFIYNMRPPADKTKFWRTDFRVFGFRRAVASSRENVFAFDILRKLRGVA